MKIKKLLKIGFFGIIFFAFIISPVFKSNFLPANAAEEAEEPEPENTEPFPVGNEAFEFAQNGGFLFTTKDIITSLMEENPNSVCNEIDLDEIINECAKGKNLVYRETVCQVKAAFAKTQCEFVISLTEGIGTMFGGIINSEIEWILNALNPSVYGGTINKGVQAIWTVLRNIVNSILILGLIGMAIATIVGAKKYAWKQILWKLILVALLVNFSLVISGTVVAVSNYLTGHFLVLSQGNTSIAPRIMTGYGYTKVEGTTNQYNSPDLFSGDKYKLTQMDPEEVEKKGVNKFTIGLGNTFIISFIMILTGGFAVIALLAIYITIIVRNVFLIMLIGFSPLAFAAWIFPATERYWKLWWNNFIKWCTFPIMFSFMLYVSLIVMGAMPPINANSSMAAIIMHMVLFSVFLVGGLILSLQAGGATAKIVIQQSDKIGKAVGSFIGKRTTEGITESATYKKAGQLLTKMPLLGGVGREMMTSGEKTRATRIKAHEKELENVDLGTLKMIEKSPLPSKLNRNEYEARIALDNTLARMGKLGDESIQHIALNKDEAQLDVKAITDSIPQYFKIENKEMVATGKSIQDQVTALGRLKPDKIRDKFSASDFMKKIMDEAKESAQAQGKALEEIDAMMDQAFDQTIQEVTNRFSPAQMAGFWKSFKDEDLIEKGWGGTDGKIVQAIQKDPDAERKFYEQMIPSSLALREASGISRPAKEDKNQSPPPPPPPPGYQRNPGGTILIKK